MAENKVANNNNYVSLANVNKIYPNGVQAVFDFNLDIKKQEFVVFVGPSGCGKSTTLRMIAGLEDISSGVLYIDGKLMNVVEPKDRNIAMVFQNYALYPHMTVYGNMEFALKLRKVEKPVFVEPTMVEGDPDCDAAKLATLKVEKTSLLKQIKNIDRKYKKDQNNLDVLAERANLFKTLLNVNDEIAKLMVPVIGIDQGRIVRNQKAIIKLQKENEKSVKLLEKYGECDDATNIKALENYMEMREKQIADLTADNEHLVNNEVHIVKMRKLTSFERFIEINKVAESIDLVRYLYRKPAALSGGQRQRVALGRAIVRKPKVFLMDEPLSNLDAKLRVQTRSEIAKIHQAVGATTIYVTHDQTEALTLADRIVIMKDGYIQQIGTPKEVYNDPANKFVGGFIGSPAMNFLKGKISTTGKFVANMENESEGKFEIKLNDKLLELVKPYKGKEILLGVRPEDTYPASVKGSALSDEIQVDVDYTELLGKEHVIYSLAAGQKLIMKTLEDIDASRGLKIGIKVDTKKLFFFDPETEMRIK